MFIVDIIHDTGVIVSSQFSVREGLKKGILRQ
jgi:hypothetical protein